MVWKEGKSIIDQFLSPPTGNYIQQSETNSTGDKKNLLQSSENVELTFLP